MSQQCGTVGRPKPNILHIQQFRVPQLWEWAFRSQSHAFVLCTLRMTFPQGVFPSLFPTARLDLQRHSHWLTTSERCPVAPLAFLDLFTHRVQECPPRALSRCVLAPSLSFSSVFFTPAKSIGSVLGQGREDGYRRGWGSPPPTAELCLAGSLRQSSSFPVGMVVKSGSGFHGPQ